MCRCPKKLKKNKNQRSWTKETPRQAVEKRENQPETPEEAFEKGGRKRQGDLYLAISE